MNARTTLAELDKLLDDLESRWDELDVDSLDPTDRVVYNELCARISVLA